MCFFFAVIEQADAKDGDGDGENDENKVNDEKEDGDDGDAAETDAPAGEEAAKKKKKKKNKNKNKGKTDGKKVQTTPPTISIVELFPDGIYPEGEILRHPTFTDDRKAADRFTSEEKRTLDRLHTDIYNELRLAAEAHRQTRQYIQNWVELGYFPIILFIIVQFPYYLFANNSIFCWLSFSR